MDGDADAGGGGALGVGEYGREEIKKLRKLGRHGMDFSSCASSFYQVLI
jgi:hypothetical protein